jgi:hypothetical protein
MAAVALHNSLRTWVGAKDLDHCGKRLPGGKVERRTGETQAAGDGELTAW